MLTTGLSVVEQIFVCDEGVMGFHNDRRAGGKMPATGSWRGNFYNYIIIHSETSLISKHIRRDMERVYIAWIRISWLLFVLFLSRVHQVHSFVTEQKSVQAMRPCRQHLLLNKLLSHKFNHFILQPETTPPIFGCGEV